MQTTLTIKSRNRRVRLQEGDIVFTRWPRVVPSAIIASLNDGMSHVGILLAFDGKLYVAEATLSAAPLPDDHFLKNSNGQIIRNGVHAQLVDDSFSRAKHMWILRPSTPYTTMQLDAIKVRFKRIMDQTDGNLRNHTYEKSFLSMEYLYAIMGWLPFTKTRYMCSETVAVLLRAAGRWEYTTSAMPIHIRDRTPGEFLKVF